MAIYCKYNENLLIDHVQSAPNTHDGMAVTDEEELVASAVAYPGSTEEVQKIVHWANKYLIPLHPISMGRNCTSRSNPLG